MLRGVNTCMKADMYYFLPVTSELKLWMSALCSDLSKAKQLLCVVVGCIDESAYRK